MSLNTSVVSGRGAQGRWFPPGPKFVSTFEVYPFMCYVGREIIPGSFAVSCGAVAFIPQLNCSLYCTLIAWSTTVTSFDFLPLPLIHCPHVSTHTSGTHTSHTALFLKGATPFLQQIWPPLAASDLTSQELMEAQWYTNRINQSINRSALNLSMVSADRMSFLSWKYYFSLVEITDKNVAVSCLLCAGVKNLSTAKSSHSNLMKHLLKQQALTKLVPSSIKGTFVLLLDLKACCPVDYNK